MFPVTLRETLAGWEHLRLSACKRLFKMKADAFVSRYDRYRLPVEVCLESQGEFICCEVCGFAMIRAHFDSGWQMEMCSALPIVNFDSKSFQDWLSTLASKPG